MTLFRAVLLSIAIGLGNPAAAGAQQAPPVPSPQVPPVPTPQVPPLPGPQAPPLPNPRLPPLPSIQQLLTLTRDTARHAGYCYGYMLSLYSAAATTSPDTLRQQQFELLQGALRALQEAANLQPQIKEIAVVFTENAINGLRAGMYGNMQTDLDRVMRYCLGI
jgi:hypothetical protein